MQLALSGRLWETPHGPTLTLNEQIQAAAELGYQGFEIRYPLLPPQSEWESVRETLQRHNVQLVFTSGAGAPSTPEKRTDFVRVLDTVEFLGGQFVKQIPKDETEFDAMRLAADLGAERGIKVLPQYHSNTLTDTVEKTERFFRTLDHPNLGLIFDACHIPFSETLSIEEAVARLRPWIDLVNLQSYKPATPDDGLQHVAINGREWSLALPDDPAGTDLKTTVEVLRAQGYKGWWVVMPAVDPTMEPLAVAKAYHDFLTPLL
jgi:sugar phosphate isomerase/epimerase